MRDADVRNALRSDLDAFYAGDGHTRIVEEMGIWSGTVRIDMAVINGKLHGYELKSASDTLDRLESQAELYNEVFDHMTLVTAEKHFLRAHKRIPEWWGIMIAVPNGGSSAVQLRLNRKPTRNPAVVPLQIARLLWRPEAIEILARYKLDKGFRSASVEKIAARIAQELPLPVLQSEVRQTLKGRESWLRQVPRHET